MERHMDPSLPSPKQGPLVHWMTLVMKGILSWKQTLPTQSLLALTQATHSTNTKEEYFTAAQLSNSNGY